MRRANQWFIVSMGLFFFGIGACGQGERRVEYFKNGQKKLEQELKRGTPHGKTTHFFPNGKKAVEGQYENGMQHGVWVFFHQDGRRKGVREYRHGVPDGQWIEWDAQGRVIQSELYRGGFYERPRIFGEYLGQHKPGLTPELFAPGVVSTERYEFGCTFAPDGRSFYFTRNDGEYTEGAIYVMSREDGGGRWSRPEVASFSGRYSDIEPMIAPDGYRFFFGSTRPLVGQGGDKDTDIWFMERTSQGWSEPRNAGPAVNESTREFHASATHDGTVYFAGFGAGGGDIFRARMVAGTYSVRQALPFPINSDAQETHPFVAPDESYLLFERGPSYVHFKQGVGGETQSPRGLFISFRTAGDTWSSPQRLSREINGDRGAGFPMVSPDGKFLFFSQEGEIYWVDCGVLEIPSRRVPK